MSAAFSQSDHVDTVDPVDDELQPGYDGPTPARDLEEAPVGAVVVRRNAGLAALVGAGASAVAIAYLWRATQSGAAFDWALCVVMAAIGAAYLANLVDARTPLLVADELGLRVRLGHQWRGLPWDAVGSVAVQPRRGWRDGRLLFAPHSLGRALDGLDARGRRAAATNQRVYGAALAVPVGLTTRISVPTGGLVERLELLAQGRAEVVLVPAADPQASPRDDEREPLPAAAPVQDPAVPLMAEPESDPFAAEPPDVEPDTAADELDADTDTNADTDAHTEPDADADADADAEPDADTGDTGDAGSGDRPVGRRGSSRGLTSGFGAVVARLAPGPRRETVMDIRDDVEERSGDRPGGAEGLGGVRARR